MTWIILAIIVIWLIVRNSKSKNQPPIFDEKLYPSDNSISEENVLKIQTQFEEHLGDTFLPDAITRVDLYTYKNLMRVWFSDLSAKHRYDDSMTQKLRNDWLDYMESLKDAHTYHYLYMELEDESKTEDYRKKGIIASRKLKAIEDGFAAAMGKEYIDELSKIRNLDFNSVSRDGELAPEGMEFGIDDKLRKKKNHHNHSEA